jgi:hypothetical protein
LSTALACDGEVNDTVVVSTSTGALPRSRRKAPAAATITTAMPILLFPCDGGGGIVESSRSIRRLAMFGFSVKDIAALSWGGET